MMARLFAVVENPAGAISRSWTVMRHHSIHEWHSNIMDHGLAQVILKKVNMHMKIGLLQEDITIFLQALLELVGDRIETQA